jgi:hypothetical protein
LNASVVVAARAMGALYITLWLCVKTQIYLAEEHAIHRSAWKGYSLKSISGILHSSLRWTGFTAHLPIWRTEIDTISCATA